MDFSYTIVKRNVKYPRLEFKFGDLFVIVPAKEAFDVHAFIARHRRWISKHKQYFTELDQEADTVELQLRLALEFTELVDHYIKQGSVTLGVCPKVVTFKAMRSRWGTCTSAGKITINTKLRFFPDTLIGYVVFHELVHLLVHNHGPKFYALLKTAYPEYKKIDRLLVQYEYILHKKTHR